MTVAPSKAPRLAQFLYAIAIATVSAGVAGARPDIGQGPDATGEIYTTTANPSVAGRPRNEQSRPEDDPTGNPLWAIPLSALNETRERPIFLPSRRPPAPAVTSAIPAPPRRTEQPPPSPPPLALVGSIVSDPERIAVFRNETTKEVIRLRPGEGHTGWVLRELNRLEAVLQSSHDTIILALPRPSGEGK